jgi:hypothetical protein
MLYVGNDSLVQLLGIQAEDGTYLTSQGPITCTVTDPSNNVLATITLTYTGQPVTIGDRTFADGNWSGTLPASTPLVAGTTYAFTYNCANPAFQFVRYETAATRKA